MSRWEALWAIGEYGYNFDNMAQHNLAMVQKSIAENPYYFSNVLSGAIVEPGGRSSMPIFKNIHAFRISAD